MTGFKKTGAILLAASVALTGCGKGGTEALSKCTKIKIDDVASFFTKPKLIDATVCPVPGQPGSIYIIVNGKLSTDAFVAKHPDRTEAMRFAAAQAFALLNP